MKKKFEELKFVLETARSILMDIISEMDKHHYDFAAGESGHLVQSFVEIFILIENLEEVLETKVH